MSEEKTTGNSDGQVWWQCSKSPEHAFRAAVNKCPYCSDGQLVSKENSFAAMFPTLAKHWDRARNGSTEPTTVASDSSTSVWWRCPELKRHAWQTVSKTVADLKEQGVICPVC